MESLRNREVRSSMVVQLELESDMFNAKAQTVTQVRGAWN
jgi:hypothetical protein